ncbi:hypothetical protein [Aldersonia kunmingensis]|uniref:hypothetical protein n=1 Tax=Aldersonia kunmingensis TaxID=408066 RepID=UPI00083486F7|nr:hypothetical protein [Aldersonia kunmingensis]
MAHWFQDQIVERGRLPLFCFLLGFIAAFAFIRFSVRMIRAQVKWWPGNITPGGQHIHHVVFGVVTMIVSGGALIAIYEDGSSESGAILAALFGIGAALVLDEFALIFYLKDVYWAEQGRSSVDAVFAAIAVTGLALMGLHPAEMVDFASMRDTETWWEFAVLLMFGVMNLALAAIVILKGKIWTALIGLFIFPILLVGSIRLGRPGAPWARWRYTTRPKKMQRAVRRERRQRRPMIRAKIYVQDIVAGQPSIAHARAATEEELDRIVVPARPPHEERLPEPADY